MPPRLRIVFQRGPPLGRQCVVTSFIQGALGALRGPSQIASDAPEIAEDVYFHLPRMAVRIRCALETLTM